MKAEIALLLLLIIVMGSTGIAEKKGRISPTEFLIPGVSQIEIDDHLPYWHHGDNQRLEVGN